jgi:hypothetical protein
MSTLSLFRGFEDDMKRAQTAFDKRKLEDGLAILERYKGLLTIDTKFMFLYAQLLNAKGGIAEAETILTRLVGMEPANSSAVVLRAQCMAGLGRRAEALKSLDDARKAYPNDNSILGNYLAQLLTEQGPAAAIAVLRQEYQRRTPPRRLDTAIEKLRQKALSLYDSAELRKLDPEDMLELELKEEGNGYSLRLIYEAFESCGANCELGFVQRRSGAEPLSLFRWTFVSPEKLIEMLACDLEGYERPDIYTLHGDTQREFILWESLFGTKSHTGVYDGDIPKDEFLDRLIRRQAFLKRKFLADAAQGRKIFTYKGNDPLTEEQMAGIEAQLRRLGVRHVLFVMPTQEPGKAGTVSIVSPVRAVAYLSSVMPTIQYEEWSKIAIATYDQFVRNVMAA